MTWFGATEITLYSYTLCCKIIRAPLFSDVAFEPRLRTRWNFFCGCAYSWRWWWGSEKILTPTIFWKNREKPKFRNNQLLQNYKRTCCFPEKHMFTTSYRAEILAAAAWSSFWSISTEKSAVFDFSANFWRRIAICAIFDAVSPANSLIDEERNAISLRTHQDDFIWRPELRQAVREHERFPRAIVTVSRHSRMFSE